VTPGESLDIVVTLKSLEPIVFDEKSAFITVNLRGAKPLLLPFSADVVLPDVSIVEERCVGCRGGGSVGVLLLGCLLPPPLLHHTTTSHPKAADSASPAAWAHTAL
jgi:hypothetical protein